MSPERLPALREGSCGDNNETRIKKIVNKPGNKQEVTVYIPVRPKHREGGDGIYEYSYTKNSGTIDNNRNYNTLHIIDPSTGSGQGGTTRVGTQRTGNDADDSTPAQKYFVEDHLGNCSVTVKTNGGRINMEEYYPFGQTSFGSFAKKRYRYNGKEKDEHTGLYEYGQRYYAPWLCRFVSVDPISEDYPHYTSYNYAGNKPISKRDLEGLQEENAERPVDQGQNNVELENPKDVVNKSAMPKNENLHNAPERIEFGGKQGTDFDIASPGLAQTAFSDGNENKGQVRSGNKNYKMEVFWNPNTKLTNGIGAYVWQRSKVEPRVQMEAIELKGRATKIKHPELAISETKLDQPQEQNATNLDDKPEFSLQMDTNITVNLPIQTDGSFISTDYSSNTYDPLDVFIDQIISAGDNVSSITINSQIGTGRGPKDLEYSQNLFQNVRNYIQQRVPNLQINRGWVGPAAGNLRIDPTQPLSININSR